MNTSTFFVLIAWLMSVLLLPAIAILEGGGWPTAVATVGALCMLGTSMPLVKEFCAGRLPATLSDVYRDVLFDVSMCSSGVLLSVRVATDPAGNDLILYLSALAAISIAITRSCAQTLPSPVGDSDLLELRGLEQPLSSQPAEQCA